MKQNDLFWIWLSLRLGAANPAFLELFRCIGGPYDVYRATEEQIDKVKNISKDDRESLADKNLSEAQSVLNWVHDYGATLCKYGQDDYPKSLSSIKRPPLLLYVKGKLPDLSKRFCVSIVGTRDCTEYGAHASYKLSYELATAGTCIVSGMAKGIDGVAAAGALAAGGTTVAVLGCGLATAYPKCHTELMQVIARHGAVITEYPPMSPPDGRHFPVRNRIISGLSDCTVVVEAPEKSGAMITAEIATEHGRGLFATPGNIDSEESKGSNLLIRYGADAVLTGTDVTEPFLQKFQKYLRPEKILKLGDKAEYNPRVFRKLAMPDYAEVARIRREDEKAIAALHEQPIKGLAIPLDQMPKNVHTPHAAEVKVAQAVPKPVSVKPTEEQILAATAGLPACAVEVYRFMSDGEPKDADGFAKLGLPASQIVTALTLLEVRKLIHSLPGGRYEINSRTEHPSV